MVTGYEQKRVERAQNAPVLMPFSDEVMSFLQDLSDLLMKEGRQYADVMAFAFWCRRAALRRYRDRYPERGCRLGRGLLFHIAPSNVPVMFAYSLAAGLLAGNKNIVRLSDKPFAQADLITDAIEKLICGRHPRMEDYIYLMRCGHDAQVIASLSAAADIRVIWGGDAAIREIRQAPLGPGAAEILFADRYGICVISSEDYLQSEDKDLLIHRFYNDTYLFDQNACTSPQVLIWTGDQAEEAGADFWGRLREKTEKDYRIEPAQITNKLSAFMEAAACEPVRLQSSLHEPKLMVAAVSRIDERLMQYRCGCGFFYEYHASDLREILPLLTRRCGTITYFGHVADQLLDLVTKAGCAGGDRIVPVGSALDFSLIWDGVDLIRAMSRLVTVI